ncbi:MAG TPA: pseudouridine-5'-phosphate glycosidase [Thermotogota bacterium]|nr:pseudouridine-5'-phosphate glycosidase [Thermotogota bacterium]HRW91415.1 pseudouridine-5'-phosphate glycosidase [Thermotogota bacterium]
MDQPIRVSPEIESALNHNQPVVALESTVIAQGLPYPRNLEVAQSMEQTIRHQGAIPATIGILEGVVYVGMSPKQVETLGDPKNTVLKVGAAEIPFAVGLKKNAATTVSATSLLARVCGIHCFATGGIGGVHRGVSESYDVSQDIQVLSHTPIVVVSAGAKSILDLPKTCEKLESEGILVLGYQTSHFPAFYCRTSPISLSFRVESPEEVARVFWAKTRVGNQGALLVANPVPQKDEIPYDQADSWIRTAIDSAHEMGFAGKELTPFLLKTLAENSGGKTLESNISLLLHNAYLAAQIAIAIGHTHPENPHAKMGFVR